MIIKTDQIRSFLKKENISYEWKGKPAEEYKIASIFDPIHNGFYYFIGDKLPDEIDSSLILTNKTFGETNNCILQISCDPKALFYKILSFLYKRSSDGKISEMAVIHPQAIIGNNVQVDPFTIIGKCKIGDNCIIGSHSKLYDNTIIKANSIIDSHAAIGTQGVAWTWSEDMTEKIRQPQLGGVLIGENCFLGANAIIVRGSLNEKTFIGQNTMMAPGARIGHGTQVGSSVHFANDVVTGGNTVIGDYSFVGSGAIFRPQVEVHKHTIVGAGAVVVKNTSAERLTLIGVPAKEIATKKAPSGMPVPKE